MSDVYLALGSNQQPAANIRAALRRLQARYRLCRVSPIYETLPWGYTPQPMFLNCVAHLRTTDSPLDVLRHGQRIEGKLQRRRTVRNGPRTIDVDVLMHGGAVLDTPALTLPHPGLTERDFMLLPLLDLARTARHPDTARPLAEARDSLRYRCIVARWRNG